MKASKISLLALSVALAMILSYVESQLPTFVPIPGIKIGLANIVVVFALYKLGWKEALVVSAIRVYLLGVMFGTGLSLPYSAAGAAASFLTMAALKRTNIFSYTAVSVAGGVMHNMGQLTMAAILTADSIRYYAPFLILSGTLAGIAIGQLAAILVRRIELK